MIYIMIFFMSFLVFFIALALRSKHQIPVFKKYLENYAETGNPRIRKVVIADAIFTVASGLLFALMLTESLWEGNYWNTGLSILIGGFVIYVHTIVLNRALYKAYVDYHRVVGKGEKDVL